MTPDAHAKSKKSPNDANYRSVFENGSSIYKPISQNVSHENPDEFADAFARAWFKLTSSVIWVHVLSYLGPVTFQKRHFNLARSRFRSRNKYRLEECRYLELLREYNFEFWAISFSISFN